MSGTHTPQTPAYRQRLGYHATLLAMIGLLSSAALVIGDLQTRDEIALRQQETLQRLLGQVLPEGLYDRDPVGQVVEIDNDPERDKVAVYRAVRGRRVEGVAFKVQGQGYSAPPIVLVMGVAADGRLLGVRVVSHAETPGLGDKIEIARDLWITSFDGRSLNNTPPTHWTVRKEGGAFDQFTGATITPRAVVRAVHDGLHFFERHRERLLEPPAEEQPEAPPEEAAALPLPDGDAPVPNTEQEATP